MVLLPLDLVLISLALFIAERSAREEVNQRSRDALPVTRSSLGPSPPRVMPASQREEWRIPPAISNWKNPKGYTIPLDQRLQGTLKSLSCPLSVAPSQLRAREDSAKYLKNLLLNNAFYDPKTRSMREQTNRSHILFSDSDEEEPSSNSNNSAASHHVLYPVTGSSRGGGRGGFRGFRFDESQKPSTPIDNQLGTNLSAFASRRIDIFGQMMEPKLTTCTEGELASKVKAKATAPVQVTAQQILREAYERNEADEEMDLEEQGQVSLEYKDKEGRSMTVKEAFRQMSYQFHGKTPGKAKQAKRKRKMELDLQDQQETKDLMQERNKEGLKKVANSYNLYQAKR